MPDLQFAVESAAPVRTSAIPRMGFRVAVIDSDGELIHSILLNCQVRIEPAGRRYEAAEQERLFDQFGNPERWGQTVRPRLWENISIVVPRFERETIVELPVPCSFDMTIAATRFFDALESGDVPLSFLFNGTVFYEGQDGNGLRAVPIPWDREARFRLPVAVWKELIERFYPNMAWLALRKDLFDRLQQFKSRSGLSSWEEALEVLLANEEVVPS